MWRFAPALELIKRRGNPMAIQTKLVEYDDEGTKVFRGNWIDPFEIETL